MKEPIDLYEAQPRVWVQRPTHEEFMAEIEEIGRRARRRWHLSIAWQIAAFTPMFTVLGLQYLGIKKEPLGAILFAVAAFAWMPVAFRFSIR